MNQRRISLRTLLIVPFVLQVFGITALVGYLSYRSGRQSVEDLAKQVMQETSTLVTHDLDQYLQQAHDINQTHVAALQAGVLRLENLDELHRYFTVSFLQTPAVQSFLFGSPQGDFRFINRVRPDEFGINANLRVGDLPFEAGIATADNPGWLNIYSVDVDGQLVRPIEKIKVDVRQRPWYRRAVATQAPGWTEPFQIGRSNILTINAYTPVYDDANSLQGVFAVNLSLRRLNDFLETLSISDRGQAFIIDRQGLLIANSVGKPLYVSEPLTGSTTTPQSGYTQPGLVEFRRLSALDSLDPVMSTAVQQLNQQVGSLATIQAAQQMAIKVDEERHFLRVVPYRDGYGLDWLIVTVVPRADFMVAIDANVRRTIWLCALATCGSVMSSVWLSRRIGRSLQRLNHATQAIAAGDLDYPLSSSRVSEVATLSAAFSKMATALQTAAQFRQDYEQLLETQVAEQTTALSAAQQIAHVGSWEFDVAQQQVVWSDELYRIYEADPDVPVPRPDLTIQHIHPDDEDHYQQQIIQPVADGRSFDADLRIITQTGRTRYIQSKGQPKYDQQGQVVKWVGTAADITERKQLEQALQASERQLKEVFDHAIAGIASMRVFLDGTWEIDRVSAGSELISGFTSEELTTDNYLWTNRILPEDRQVIAANIFDYIFAGKMSTCEYRFRHKDGSLRWFSQTSNPIWHEAQQCWVVTAMSVDITDRKQAEVGLQKSQDQLQLITDSVAGAIAYVDAQQRYQFVNRTYETWFNCDRATLLGKTVLAVIGPIAYERARPYVERALAGNSVAYEAEMPYQGGQTRYISAVLVPQQTDDVVEGYYSLVTDISDRKQAELELQNLNQKLQTFLDNAPASISLFSAKGHYLQVNPTFERLTNLPAKEIVGKHFREFVPLETVTLFEKRIQLLQATQSALVVEDELVLKGQTRYFQSILFPTSNESQHPQTFWSITNDISEQKKAELILKASEERFRQVFVNAPIGIALVDLKGRLFQVNQALCDFIGYAPADLMAMAVADISHPDDMGKDQHLFEQVLAGQIETYQIEKRYFHQQGHIVYGLLSVALLHDADRQPLYFICQVQDISERYKIDQMKRDFVSTVSHELRTPLTSMRGALGILATGVLHNKPQKAQHMTQVALDNTDRLIRLVNQILDLNRLESGYVSLVMEPCQVDDLLKTAVQGLAPMAEAAHITIMTCSIRATVQANADAIIQTLTNLLSNAIKFSNAGSRVWLEAKPWKIGVEDINPAIDNTVSHPLIWQLSAVEPQLSVGSADTSLPVSHSPTSPPPSSALLFSVRDQGCGIPEDKLDLIFEPFQQVDASDSRNTGGSGLGLAISKTIVEKHGGTLWVESTLNLGSTFYFTLPGLQYE
jgi:PAS domain S-box-containing protein